MASAALLCMALSVYAADRSAGPATSAAAVIERHLQAIGGKDRLEGLKSQRLKIDAQEGQHSFSAEFSVKDGGKYLFRAFIPSGFTVRHGYDGQGHWWREDPDGVREITDRNDQRGLREMMLALSAGGVLDLMKSGPQLLLGGVERAGARECQVVELKKEPNPPWKLLFDTASGRLVQLGNTRLEDYRPEQGILLPHRISSGDGLLLKITAVEFNVTLADKEFAIPPGSAPGGKPATGPGMYSTSLNPRGQLGIVRQPEPATFKRTPSSLPAFNAESQNPFEVDLRGADLSGMAVEDRLTDLLHAVFDSRTVWPAKLPEGFNPQQILERAKNPGLGLRALHERGVTGKGVGIAIIDQTLLVNHCEYKDHLRSYEEIHSSAGAPAQMHGPAVASIAVGKTLGVAPGADLYYIAETHGAMHRGEFESDFTWLAQSIERILEINRSLPKEHKIRVISISVGWSPGEKGCAEADAAVEKAKADGVFVISTALERTYHLAFHGLGRLPDANPELASSYGIGSWWAKSFYSGRWRFQPGQRLLVPMDARTTASPTAEKVYAYYPTGGWRWCVRYLAAVYALSCQVHPAITPELFWQTALKTGQTIPIEHEGKSYQLGTVVNPSALIEAVAKF